MNRVPKVSAEPDQNEVPMFTKRDFGKPAPPKKSSRRPELDLNATVTQDDSICDLATGEKPTRISQSQLGLRPKAQTSP